MEYLLFIGSFFAILLCNVVESYAYIIKGYILKGNERKTIGLASWIQYCARILYVFVLLFLSALYEFFGFRQQILYLLLWSTMISLVAVGCVFYSIRFRYFVNLIVRPLVKFTYPDLIKERFPINVSNFSIKTKIFVVSFVSSFMLGMALILPFVVAIKYPEYRMMATYIGQFINFFATALTFSYIEPKLFSELDSCTNNTSDFSEIGKNILYSKFLSLIFVNLIIILIVL